MSVIPDTIEQWTLETVRTLARDGNLEDDRFDFKKDLQPADHQRKVVAAFANTRGGFLVFGVTNNRHVVGVENKELARDFGNKLTKGLEPSVEFTFGVPFALESGRQVFVCHVPQSSRGPHAVFVNDAWVFFKRTAAGTCPSATFDEIRGAFLEAGRRRSELAWLRAEVQRIRALAYRMNVESSRGSYTLDLVLSRLDATQLRTLLVGVFEYLNATPYVVPQLHELVERCEKVDAALAATKASLFGANDAPVMTGAIVVPTHASAIVMLADRLLPELDRLLK